MDLLPVKKILIIKPSSLGDIVHALLVVQSLKEQMPDLEVSWVVRDIFAPLVIANHAVSQIFIYKRYGGASAFGKLLGQIHACKFDWVWDMQGLARSGILTLLARAPRKNKIGRCDSREGSRFACGKIIELPPTGKKSHAVDILRPFLSAMGQQTKITPVLKFGALPPLPKRLTADSLSMVVLFPSSRRAEKEWPKFRELTERLLNKYKNIKVVWAGNEQLESEVHWNDSKRFYNVSAHTSIPELIQLIQSAKIVVCNDSGPMHIAAAVDTELIALFGPTGPKQYGPYPIDKPIHHIIEAEGQNLATIKVDTVLEEIDKCFGNGNQNFT